MKKVFVHKIRVQGNGAFPIDMLRYDQCYPASQEDALKIASSFNKPLFEENIIVVAIHFKDWIPTYNRWVSFGWPVVKHVVGMSLNNGN